MKKMQKLGVMMMVVALISSCTKEIPFDYKHVEKEQVISCNGVDDRLLNEALYTFEEDLLFAYGAESKILSQSYGRFLFTGFSGTAQYDQFASPHAIKVKEALMAEGILIEGGLKSNLNYKHPAVQCILQKIEDKEIAATIKALVDTNTMDPKLFNSRMRNFGNDAEKNRYEAMYVALDTYFQQIRVARTLPENTIDE